MVLSNLSWCWFLHSTLIWLFLSYSMCTVKASRRYPYILPKCCEPKAHNPSSDEQRPIGECESKELEVILLPKQLFPSMSSPLEHVEVKMQTMVNERKCSPIQDYLDISIKLLDISTPVDVTSKKGFTEIAFSGKRFLDAQGNIYASGHYCLSSRMTNKTHLVVKTCKRKCSKRHPCVRRCCGGHQSIFITPPTSNEESLLGFCSTPSLENSWNPRKSKVFRVYENTRFYESKYVLRRKVDGKHSVPHVNCVLLRLTHDSNEEAPLTLLNNGRLKLTIENNTIVLDDFCIDGTSLGDSSSPIDLGNTCDFPKEQEVVVLYYCVDPSSNTTPFLVGDKEADENENGVLSLPACSCLPRPSNNLIQLPTGFFQQRQNNTRNAVVVRLTTGSLECPNGYGDSGVDVDFHDDTYEPIFRNGSLIFNGFSVNTSQFCVRSVFNNALGLRICYQGVDFFLEIINMFIYFLYSVLEMFYAAICVVYVLRNDKQPVFRTSIVCYSVSMAITFALLPFYASERSFNEESGFDTRLVTFVLVPLFSYLYGFSWMSVLCFDGWLKITLLRHGNESMKLLLGYISLTLTLPAILVVIDVIFDGGGVASSVLEHLVHGVIGGLLCINSLLFLATAVKFWAVQHSRDIDNQKNLFLLYFKLFLLMGIRWIADVLIFFAETDDELYTLITLGSVIVLLLHPVFLFFFLVWDEETKRYLEINYPRIKSVIHIFAVIGYPVRKYCFCRYFKQHQVMMVTSATMTVETPHDSTEM